MLRLGGRIAAALKDKLEFPWDDFKQTFAERAEKELGQRALPAVAEEDADAEPMQLRRCRARTTAQSTPALATAVSCESAVTAAHVDIGARSAPSEKCVSW